MRWPVRLPLADDNLPLGESPAEVGQRLEVLRPSENLEKAAPYTVFESPGQATTPSWSCTLGDRDDLDLLWGETYWYRGELEPVARP
jgi:hypothetical protein